LIFRIDPASERAIYVQIMDEVKRAMVTDALAPHEALPSVRQLASELKVNPNTVKQAYRELEHEGLVYTERGRGTFVSAWDGRRRDRERAGLVRSLAGRAVQEAIRHGISPAELAEAMRQLADEAEREGVA